MEKLEKYIATNGIMKNSGQFNNIQKKIFSYSVGEYIVRLLTVILLSLFTFILLSYDRSVLGSFIASSIAFLIITIFATAILLKSRRWVFLFSLAYLIKITIGVFHYLYFIDPLYFESSGGYKALTFEFEGVFDQIIYSSHAKILNGLTYFDYSIGGVDHQEILSLISIPFIYFGDYVLTISSINSFFSLLIAINILLISKYYFKFNNKSLKYIALATAYFPMTMIPSLLWRDVVGIASMSTGLTLIHFAKRPPIQYLMLILAGYLFYLHRTIYPILLFLAFVINIVFNKNFKTKSLDSLYKIVTIGFVIALLPLIFTVANTDSNAEMSEGILNFNPLILPLKILIGLIGPFPWINFLLYEKIPAYAYQLADYFQAAFNIAFVICFILVRKKYFRKENLNLLNIIGCFLVISGLLNSHMHTSYVSFGFMFLIPWLFTAVNLSEFKKYYLYSFISLVIINIIVVVLLGNLGISFLWK